MIITIFLLLSLVPPTVVHLLANYFPDIYLDTNRDEHGYFITTMDFGRFFALLSAANDFFCLHFDVKEIKSFAEVKRGRRCRRRRASSRQRSMATIEKKDVCNIFAQNIDCGYTLHVEPHS